jgi:hypothetical protein
VHLRPAWSLASAAAVVTVAAALAATLEALPPLVATAPAEPPPGEWSAAQVLAHLVHTELVYGVRIRTIVTADHPDIPGYDQDAFAARFPCDGDLDTWLVLRRANLRLLETLEVEEMARSGNHAERGEESVADIVGHLVHHDEEHLAQIAALSPRAAARR